MGFAYITALSQQSLWDQDQEIQEQNSTNNFILLKQIELWPDLTGRLWFLIT